MQIFSSVFGSRIARKHWQSIYACILAVDSGLKVSYLVDQCRTTQSEMSHLLQLLRGEFLSSVNLSVLGIYDNIFVVKKEHLLAHIGSILHEKPVVFIDVSQSLKEPQISEMSGTISTEIGKLYIELQNTFQSSELNTESCVPKTLALKNNALHPCTLFGLMLGYPVVYMMNFESEMNCLDEIDLSVISCEVKVNFNSKPTQRWEVVNSFSFPKHLTNFCQKSIESWKSDVEKINEQITDSNFTLNTRIMVRNERLSIVIM